MSEKHAAAARKQWKGISKEERSKKMSALARKRMKALTPRQRKLIARRLVNARKAKQVAV